MAQYIDGQRRLDCFGGYKGKDNDPTLDPVGGCRKCQPWRKCQSYTQAQWMLDFRSRIEEGNQPPCYGDGQQNNRVWFCRKLIVEENIGCLLFSSCLLAVKENKEKAVIAKRELAEEDFIQRLQRKMGDQWGDTDG